MKELIQLVTKILEMILKTRQNPPVPLPKPTLRREIGIGDLRKLLRHKFPQATIFPSDSTFQLCDISDIDAFLKVDDTNRHKYVKEAFDCDNFSYRLMGQFSVPEWAMVAFGICWTDVHALNICVDANEDIWFLEPQSDKRQSSLENWQGKIVLFITI